MADDDLRQAELERAVREAVQVHEVGLRRRDELDEPERRPLEVVPRRVHPLERVAALAVARERRGGDPAALLRARRRPEEREHDLDLVLGQPLDDLERVREHAAHGVGRHQHPHRALR